MRTFLSTALSLLLLTTSTAAKADLRLARIFSDHMVLQQEMPLHIWGWADAEDKITVDFNGKSATANAGVDGKWQINLPAMKADGETHTLAVTSGGKTIKLRDVLLGEVWICGGQSNMGRPVTGEQSRLADCPKIRLFNISGKLR